MNSLELTKTTDIIPFMEKNGEIIKEIKLPEKVMPILSKRTAIGLSGTYYKGAGTIYTCHFTNELEKGETLLAKTGILYEENKVTRLNLCGKYGIFNFKHQPMFSDLEGGCGPKEENLLVMQKKFEYSAIKEIVDVIPTDIPEHSIYAYRLKETTGSLKDTAELLKYALENDFCTAWDKNLWTDIYCYGYVRDVGDWYDSDSVAAKLGTVYALLHSLYETDLYQYLELLHLLTGDYNAEKNFVLYYSAKTVQKICPKQWDETGIDLEQISQEVFGQLLSLMLQSKACCHLENEQEWSWTRVKQLKKKMDYEIKIEIILQNLRKGEA